MVDPLGWPAETDAARVVRIAQLAGLTIRVIGPVTANVAATAAVDPADTTPQLVSAWQLLTDLALDCEALLYTDRYGELQYRTRTANTGSTTVELDPGATLLDGLQLTAELGAIVNTVIVEYGPPDTRAEVERSDAASIAAYGRRELKLSTQLADQAGAIGRAERYLAHYKAPQWSMPGATVNLRLAESAHSFPAYVEQLLDLDLDDSVTLPQLLPASPIPAYSSRVLGYVETLDPYAWSITYSLNPYGWTGD
jgi:hypothetical protein